jgi:hypothetical protein
MGVSSYHFSLSDFAKNAGLPKKRRKKAHGKKPRAFSIHLLPLQAQEKTEAATRRSLRQAFSGFARQATGIVVHVVHLR